MKSDKLSKAYPNYDQYLNFSSPRDTEKWITAVKNMYYRIHTGADRLTAFNTITAGWDNMEKLDFTHWLKYYESQTHKKYSSEMPSNAIKTAQVGYWEDINRAGYFVPIHKESPTSDKNNVAIENQIDFAVNPSSEANPTINVENNKRELIEELRGKVLSRLDSAEKLLRSPGGHDLGGNELANLMRAIYDLKERIHIVNKKSLSTKLYEDMIVREANILVRNGFTKASKILCKIADADTLSANPPANPMNNAGLPGNIPGEAPGQTPSPNNAPALDKIKEPLAEGMEGFLEGLDKGTFTPTDELEVSDTDDELLVEAQAVSPLSNKNTNSEIEVEDTPEEAAVDKEVHLTNTFDQKMDQVLQSVTIEDVVQKLEDNTKVYKTRQMPRELAYIDMMLDHLGLAPFFPTLAEATNKALDANQYILTRLEDITSRLRGTIQTNEIDLKNENAAENPATAVAKQKLQEAADKEKNRKEMRKKIEEESLQQKGKGSPAPEIEVEEDLGQPTQLTNQVPAVPNASPAAPPPPVK